MIYRNRLGRTISTYILFGNWADYDITSTAANKERNSWKGAFTVAIIVVDQCEDEVCRTSLLYLTTSQYFKECCTDLRVHCGFLWAFKPNKHYGKVRECHNTTITPP